MKGMLFGGIITLMALPLLFWNEGRAVRTAEGLVEGRGAALSVPADQINPANEGKLVHATGRARTADTVSDPVFGTSTNAIALMRKVEMFQWKETSESRGRGSENRVYKYIKDWSDELVDSSKFKVPDEHPNPRSMPYKSEKWIAPKVTLGAFTLSPSQVNRIPGDAPVKAAVPPSGAVARPVREQAGALLIAEKPDQPQIGDLRITFTKVSESDVSIVSKQVGSTFEPYRARSGSKVDLQYPGIFSADHMFTGAEEANIATLWMVRIMGFILMVIGFRLMLKPLSLLTGGIPIIGSLVGAGLTLVAGLLAAVISFTAIGIAWIFYRPLLGIALLVVGSGAVYGLWRYLEKVRARRETQATKSAYAP